VNPTVSPDTRGSGRERYCDIIMKGGVASGVVYPSALCRLAEDYRFRSIGGTSVGAIAAAAAAAAEYRRYKPRREGRVGVDDGGFEELAKLPEWLRLRARSDPAAIPVALFHPEPSTARYFGTITDALNEKGFRRPLAILVSAPPRFPKAALLGAVPGLIVSGLVTALLITLWLWAGVAFAAAAVLVGLASLKPRWLLRIAPAFRHPRLRLLLLGILLVLLPLALIPVGVIAASTGAFVRGALRSIPDNYFGLCRGSRGSSSSDSADWPPRPLPLDPCESPKALTDWLADLIDVIADKPAGEPLTFGDLWAADQQEMPSRDELARLKRSERIIQFQVIATCLTLGTPYRLPFEGASFAGGEVPFYFRLDEWRALFPRRIIDCLESATVPEGPDGSYRRLPDASMLPVVVAARLSLSFPFLFSAVPLHAKRTSGGFFRCWFSDGGITSNFPIHFFDAPLPRWPTFGINLHGPRHPRSPEEVGNVRIYTSYEPALEDLEAVIATIGDFASSIKDALMDWRDNAQSNLLGWRDRVAHIRFGEREGGLDFFLDDATIARFSDRGQRAGDALADRFTAADPPAWQINRWLRYRSGMSALAALFGRFERGWDPEYKRIVKEFGAGKLWPWENEQQLARATKATDDLLELIERDFAGEPFAGAALPEPRLRLAPDI
jgi:predicted acylesterase/phospholipase RssA